MGMELFALRVGQLSMIEQIRMSIHVLFYLDKAIRPTIRLVVDQLWRDELISNQLEESTGSIPKSEYYHLWIGFKGLTPIYLWEMCLLPHISTIEIACTMFKAVRIYLQITTDESMEEQHWHVLTLRQRSHVSGLFCLSSHVKKILLHLRREVKRRTTAVSDQHITRSWCWDI